MKGYQTVGQQNNASMSIVDIFGIILVHKIEMRLNSTAQPFHKYPEETEKQLFYLKERSKLIFS